MVMMAQFIVGYNLVVMNSAEKYIFPQHSLLSWSFLVAFLAIGALIGAYSGGYISNLLGRRWDPNSAFSLKIPRSTIILTYWIFLIGGLSMFISPFIEFLMIGRFFVGCGSGLSMVVGPIYLGKLRHVNFPLISISKERLRHPQFADVLVLVFNSLLSSESYALQFWLTHWAHRLLGDFSFL